MTGDELWAAIQGILPPDPGHRPLEIWLPSWAHPAWAQRLRDEGLVVHAYEDHDTDRNEMKTFIAPLGSFVRGNPDKGALDLGLTRASDPDATNSLDVFWETFEAIADLEEQS